MRFLLCLLFLPLPLLAETSEQGNTVTIKQSGGGKNSITIKQSGEHNQADIYQEGEENELTATQIGESNTLKRHQIGHSHSVIEQNGEVTRHKDKGTVVQKHEN